MIKRKIMQAIISSVVAMSVIAAVPVFAASYTMNDGYAYNDVSHSGGLRKCSAGTINHVDNEYASLYLETTYYDGDVESYWSGIIESATYYSTSWEQSEDYRSIHKLYTSSSSLARDQKNLSED